MALAEREAVNTEKQENVKLEIEERRSARDQEKEPRIKCTYELSEDIVDSLEAVRPKLRRLVGYNVKRYQIVEAALKLALGDMDRLVEVLPEKEATV